jgi:hypothetical protein
VDSPETAGRRSSRWGHVDVGGGAEKTNVEGVEDALLGSVCVGWHPAIMEDLDFVAT